MAFIGILLVFLLFLAAVCAVIAALLGIGGVGIASIISGIVLTAKGDQSYGKSKKKTIGILLLIIGVIVIILAGIAAYGLWEFFV